jgi:nicotinamide-nucleotide amidase
MEDNLLEQEVARLLLSLKITIAVAESCTGGLICHRLTNISGSSDYLDRGVVTYSNRSKIELLGVSPQVISEHGAVSEACVWAMATGIRRLAGTDLGLAVSGIAGPTGGTFEKPVGTVHMALAWNEDVLEISPRG